MTDEIIYPLTILEDRYNGVYSGGKYTAWNMYPDEIPTAAFDDDVSCMKLWWGGNPPLVGVGDTMRAAVEDLRKKIASE